MSLTRGQIKALHAAARAAEIPEDLRREVQLHIGGFHSCADRTASRQGFLAVMAFYESRCGGDLGGNTAGYWHAEDAKANPTDKLVFACRREAEALGMSLEQLDQFIAGKHMSGGACVDVATASAYWLRKLLQGLLAIRRRRGGGDRGVGGSGLALGSEARARRGVGAARSQPGGAPSSGSSAPPGVPAISAGATTATPTPNPKSHRRQRHDEH